MIDTSPPAPAHASRYRPVWDRIGIVVTAVCAVHCLALPLLLPVLATSDLAMLSHHEFEWVVLGLTFVLAAAVLTHGYRHHHHRRLPLVLAAFGAAICLLRHELGAALEPLVLALGAGLIVVAHGLNLKWSRHFTGAGAGHGMDPVQAPVRT